MNPREIERLARELGVGVDGVARTVQLLDEGNTLPFITRYRRDQTGGLDEEQIGKVQQRVAAQRQIDQRRETILRSLETQQKLTDELRKKINTADTLKRLDDLYLPFKPKKQSLAERAREQGLGPLADEILNAAESCADLAARAAAFVTPAVEDAAAETPPAETTSVEEATESKAESKVDSDKQVADADAALAGASKIIAEQVAENADVRSGARRLIRKQGALVAARIEGVSDKKAQSYHDYFAYREPLAKVPPHRVLAINRGERGKVLRVSVECDAEAVEKIAAEATFAADHPHAEFLRAAVNDGVQRLLLPSLERESRRDLTDAAESHAVDVFACNLRNLLLQRPLSGKRVLAIDPGYKNGCKLAALDEFGGVLEVGMMHLVPTGKPKKAKAAKKEVSAAKDETGKPEAESGNEEATQQPAEVAGEPSNESDKNEATPDASPAPVQSEGESSAAESPDSSPSTPDDATSNESPAKEENETPKQDPIVVARATIVRLVTEHNLNLIALGNGKACRPTEEMIAGLLADELKEHDLAYLIVNEAGASVYSTSSIGREELPDHDPMHRSAVSIGRRVQDPLSELVKIDPASIGVGLYQHDTKARPMRDSLDQVVQSCVSFVGVDVNTASAALLRYVSGLNQLTARRITEHRQEHGPFRCRRQLLDVSGYGDAAFVQSAGFLKIDDGDNPLDATWVHPESYDAAGKLVELLGLDAASVKTPDGAAAFKAAVAERDADQITGELGIGRFTLDQLTDALGRPGRDPRDDTPPPAFRRDVVKLEDLSDGMELQGTVLNVVDFGAFVDIGLADSGLVHVSRMSHQYVRDPHALVAVGDQVRVWVASIDKERRRVALSMIEPGTEPPPRPPRRGKPAGKPSTGDAKSGEGQQRRSRPAKSGSDAKSGGRPPRGKKPNRDKRGRKPERKPAGPRVFEKKADGPPPELTDEMKEGKEAMRTFGDLAQFLQKKDEGDESQKSE